MKRIFACILIGALLVCMAGCVTEPDIHGTIIPNASQPSTPSEPATPSLEPSTPSSEPSIPSAPSDPSLSLGDFEGGIYVNEYAGLRCKLDSGWTFYSAEQLQELPDAVKDALDDSALKDYLEKSTQIMDMMAENLEDLTVINLLYMKLSLTEQLLYASMTEEQIIDNLLAQSDLLTDSYAQMGITVVELKKMTVTFLGQTRYALWMKSLVSGVNYYTLQLHDYTHGAYSVTVTCASYLEDNTLSLLPLFEKLD